MLIDLDTLNENQHKAVSWSEGPLLVLAGPGSGKTRVLTLRVARLIEESKDFSALALTFTNKAATEMRERIDQLRGSRTDRAHLCTFHSFAVDVLRQHGSHLGIRPDFGLLTHDQDRIAILEDVIAKLPYNGEPLPSDRKNLLSIVDRLFAESYDGGEKAPWLVHTPTWVPYLYTSYCDTLVASNRLDFGSLLHFARLLLNEKPGVARVLRLGWTHVCVDEFQDTNKAQYDLLRMIAPERSHNLFVVGDDDQIIYQWNGASPERLQDLLRDYEMNVIQLPECYRCPESIVSIANRLIAKNVSRTPGKIPIAAQNTSGHGGDSVRYMALAEPDDETEFLPMDIDRRGLRASDCVVLARSARLLNGAESALKNAGYGVYVARRKSEFESPVLRVLMETLRLANARHDRDILRRLCLAWEALVGKTLEFESVSAAAALVGGDFLRAWVNQATATATGRTRTALDRIQSDIVDSLAFPAVVEWFLEGGWKSWTGDDGEIAQEEVTTWRDLHSELASEFRYESLTLNAYLQKMDLSSKTPRPGHNDIPCMTVHGSKGLEFKHVYLIGMAQEVFPSFQALRRGLDSKELEEERRNCFVAITRVQESLTITRSRRYYGYPKGPSQFLTEMGIEYHE